MGLKVVPSDSTYRDCHPFFYEGNHRDYYLSFLLAFVLLPLFTISNAYSWRDLIPSFEVLYSLLGVYQTLKSINFQKGLGKNKKIERRKWSQKEEKYREKKNIWKNKVQRFVKTYRKKESILRQAFGICSGTSKLGKLAGSVYVC